MSAIPWNLQYLEFSLLLFETNESVRELGHYSMTPGIFQHETLHYEKGNIPGAASSDSRPIKCKYKDFLVVDYGTEHFEG